MKELTEYLECLTKIGDVSKAAVREQVDIEAEKVRGILERTAPRDSGDLFNGKIVLIIHPSQPPNFSFVHYIIIP